jgi:BlaI family penicillinase repressor
LTDWFILDRLKPQGLFGINPKVRSVTNKPTILNKGGKTMGDYELGAIQTEFAELIWEREPVSSGELVKLCSEQFEWKKSTTYTVLRKLCEKGIMKNEDGVVTSIVSREAFYAAKSGQFVEETFQGSLPAFIAAFASGKKLSKKEMDEIQQMIDDFREKADD